MCDSHYRGYGLGMAFPRVMKMMCCPPHEMSTVAKVKQLEALKAQLEDHISHIDKEIESLEKVEEEV